MRPDARPPVPEQTTALPGLRDARWVEFLQWCLPLMGLRWEGLRKVRRQVCRRVAARVKSLGLEDLAAYRRHLEHHAGEWRVLDGLCRITISRFYRDRGVFEALRRFVLPRLALKREQSNEKELRLWCVGCASGEEPYTLTLMWNLELKRSHPGLGLRVTATDVDEHMLRRAELARYPKSSLKDLPARWRNVFVESGEEVLLPRPYMDGVELLKQDARHESPRGTFQLVLCRNLVFTYFSEALQRQVLRRLLRSLEPAGFLVVGNHERLPRGVPGLRACAFPGVYEKLSATTRAVFPEAVLRPWL